MASKAGITGLGGGRYTGAIGERSLLVIASARNVLACTRPRDPDRPLVCSTKPQSN